VLLVMLHAVPDAVTVPTTTLSDRSCTVAFASDVPLRVGVVSAV
jgi:hypothetical protein